MAVCAQHLLLSRRLLWPPWLSQMVADPAVHGVEGRPDRRRLHAHGLGAVGIDLRHPAAAGAGVGVRGDYGVRIRLHASPPRPVFRATDIAAIASKQEEDGYDHLRHACKLDRARHPEGEGLATSSGRSEEGTQRYERRVQILLPDHGRL